MEPLFLKRERSRLVLREINLNDLSFEEFELATEILDNQSIEYKIMIQVVKNQTNENIEDESLLVTFLDHDTVADLCLFWHQIYSDYYDPQ